ncbi:MAG: GNAT family N-acetyltransferase, partial [bacterium]|nr:GNAT family N-acetyltransferase [bacterium]
CTLKGLARVNGVAVDEAPDEHWMEAYTRLQAMQEQDARSFRSILERVASRMCFASVVESGEVMAAGMAVREGGYVGLFGLVTDAQKRNQGFGKRLVSGLLTHAKEGGAQMAYLQVLVTNDPALSLYAKLGFEEVYRYWYRVKNN